MPIQKRVGVIFYPIFNAGEQQVPQNQVDSDFNKVDMALYGFDCRVISNDRFLRFARIVWDLESVIDDLLTRLRVRSFVDVQGLIPEGSLPIQAT